MQLRRNCTEIEEYKAQAEILTKRFVEKGYSFELLNSSAFSARIERCSLLVEKSKSANNTSNGPALPIITSYSMQHQLVRHLIRKHWHILHNDKVLGLALPVRSQVVYLGVPSLRDRIAPNVFNPPEKTPFSRTSLVITSVGDINCALLMSAKIGGQILLFLTSTS